MDRDYIRELEDIMDRAEELASDVSWMCPSYAEGWEEANNTEYEKEIDDYLTTAHVLIQKAIDNIETAYDLCG